MAISSLLQAAIERLNVSDVWLKGINASVSDDFVPGQDLESDEYVIQFKRPSLTEIRTLIAQDSVLPLVVYGMSAAVRLVPVGAVQNGEGKEGNAATDQLAEISTDFYVVFRQSGNDQLSDEAIEEFGRENAPFVLWPYWREVVHATCSRMGLPRVVLPPFRMRRKKIGNDLKEANGN